MNKRDGGERERGMAPSTRRRRGTALESAILEAAWAVLIEAGYEGFTYEAVAERAATSRPVIYRRWPQRDALLLATITEHWKAHPIDVPDTGNLRDDAIGFLLNANESRSSTTALIGAQLMTYFRETGLSFAELRKSLHRGEASAFQIIVDRAVRRGELRTAPQCFRVINLPFDLLRHDIHMTLQAVPEESILEIVDQVWLPLLQVST